MKSKNIFRHTVLGGNSYPKAQAHLAHTVQVLVAFGIFRCISFIVHSFPTGHSRRGSKTSRRANLSGQEMSDQSDDDEDSSSSHSYLPPEG